MLFETIYRRPSEVMSGKGASGPTGPLAFLASRSEGVAETPQVDRQTGQLFTGALLEPLKFRRWMLGLHEVVTSRFDWVAYADYLDPVITVAQEVIRLEGFSGCAGVYARVDLLPEAFSDGEFGPAGTTNVDLNAAFVRQLAYLQPDRACRLEVGKDSLRLETHRGEAIERKVPLPARWVRGFLQVQAAQQRAEPLIELSGAAARKMIHDIPSRSERPLFIDFGAKVPRLLRRAPYRRRGGGVVLELSGCHRLRLLVEVLPVMHKLRIFHIGQTGATVWVGESVGARLTLAISGGVNRGFSGEGDALLHDGEANIDEGAVEALRRALALRHEASVEELMIERQATASETRRGLDRLASQGLVGFDRGTGRYFHRVLPFTQTGAQPPRIRGAKKLVESGAVEVEEEISVAGGRLLRGWVRGGGGDYRVEAKVAAGRLVEGSCTCEWIRRHGLERGPCKHLLALRRRAGGLQG